MSAEGMPQAETSFLSRPLGAATSWVVRYPWTTLALSCALAVACMLLTAARLGFHTSRLDLLNPKSNYNQLWLKYVEEFGDVDDAVVVFQADDPAALTAAIDEVAERVEQQPKLFRSVLSKVDLAKLRSKGLYFLTAEQLSAIHGFVEPLRPVLAGQWTALRPSNLLLQACGDWRQAAADPADRATALAEKRLVQLLEGLSAACEKDAYQSPWPAMPEASATARASGAAAEPSSASIPAAPRYLVANQGKVGFLLLQLVDQEDDSHFDRGSKSIDELRRTIEQTAAAHPHIKIGLTGLPVMENDEMRESADAMWQANVLSLVGVSLVVIACFGGIRHPLLAAAAFMLALAWSFGYTTLVVGHLNILSAAFGAILIGIGMDFGIHYVARYVELRNAKFDADAALVEASRGVGPGIVTGGVTTAIAFFTVALTDFTGVVELGVISGGGVLLCIVAAMLVLPAMVRLVDRRREFDHVPEPLPVDRWIAPLWSRPGAVFVSSLAATALIALGCWQLRYDHNLLNLQPEGLESVVLEEQLLSQSDQSLWYAVTLCNSPAELREKQKQFLKMPSVQRTEEVVSMLPADADAKRPHIEALGELLAALPRQLPVLPVDSLADVEQALAQCEQIVASGGGDSAALPMIRQLRAQARVATPGEIVGRLAGYQQRACGELLARLHALAQSANPSPPSLADLPRPLVDRFVGHNGKFALRIYGRGNLWDMASLEKFVHDVKRVDPNVTGKPLQTYYASWQMQKSYIHAACYALVAITIAIILDFGNLRDSLLALLPMMLGVAQMFGLMGLFDIPLNAANMIALPLLLGIGLDTGVHIVHDYRSQGGRYRVSGSTAVSVLITALTTIVGFGALMIAGHRGLQSLGRVMTIGATCCLVTSLITLPALLTWISRARKEEATDDAPNREPISQPIGDRADTAMPEVVLRAVPKPHFALSTNADRVAAAATTTSHHD